MLRDAANEPATAASGLPVQPPIVHFRHPGYAEGSNRLLSLPALDSGGIDYDVALAACGIIANNQWARVFLTTTKSAEGRIARPDNGLLCERLYFVHVEGAESVWPAVVRLEDWRFPHGNLPVPWDAPEPVQSRDAGRCALSNYADGLEGAHLVELKNAQWWNANELDDYAASATFSGERINSDANIMFLRADLHRTFDERHYTLVPKRNPDGAVRLVVHVFTSTPSGQLRQLWHNRGVHASPIRELLFARFAWTILNPNLTAGFLTPTTGIRHILVWDAETGKHTVETRDRDSCLNIPERLRSRSPTKRMRMDSVPALPPPQQRGNGKGSKGPLHEEKEEDMSWEMGSKTDSGYDEHREEDEQEDEPRGRSRKRLSDVGSERVGRAAKRRALDVEIRENSRW
ncbi:hypothetical protein BT67DRAFT_442514 [Trichocladium antarcticum]|uniref:HNH nuclease domain-containing protein n=1 Tax=Trichocladium antarcticum TaxID=1450529 RepID=A0AAN6UJ81_9PEZI|nr:hypothetical protein BT67DRAFT_442514 [Trichocladium antarcticum]